LKIQKLTDIGDISKSLHIKDVIENGNIITRKIRAGNNGSLLNATRDKIHVGMKVQIVQKQDQRTRKLTEGIVKRILTSSDFHPHGIKVELDDGKIGRVQNIL
jgi:uncharacterized repeat protein (TIGR03833 family)